MGVYPALIDVFDFRCKMNQRKRQPAFSQGFNCRSIVKKFISLLVLHMIQEWPEGFSLSILKKIKQFLRDPSYLKVFFFGMAVTPTNTGRVMVETNAHGLKLLHTAGTVTEAEWLRQALSEAGFRMEYVPSASTGIFGTSGNSSIYVEPEDYDEASEFLRAYLDGGGGVS